MMVDHCISERLFGSPTVTLCLRAASSERRGERAPSATAAFEGLRRFVFTLLVQKMKKPQRELREADRFGALLP